MAGGSKVAVRDNDRTRPLFPALATALTLAACGGSSAGDSTQARSQTAGPSKTQPGSPPQRPSNAPLLHKATPESVAVINGWADSLRAGHVKKAATYFDLPVIIQNAGPALRLTRRSQVLLFNSTLPCGAHVVKTVAGERYTVATFVLTERPGAPSRCGATGQLAATAFLLRHGKISEWRRVLVPPPLGPPENLQTPQPSA
jgi:hypothetical protein